MRPNNYCRTNSGCTRDARVKAARVGKKADLSTGTHNNIERGAQTDPKLSTLRAIQKALESEGIGFIEHEKGDFGIILGSKKRGGICNILIIDDHTVDRELYKAWLKAQRGKEYKIMEATNAKDGCEAFVNYNPHVILLDFMMYGKDGFQLLIEMKKEHALIPRLPLLPQCRMRQPKKRYGAWRAYLLRKEKSHERKTIRSYRKGLGLNFAKSFRCLGHYQKTTLARWQV